jgi:hypothetical protein
MKKVKKKEINPMHQTHTHVQALADFFARGQPIDDFTARYLGGYLDEAFRYEAVIEGLILAGADVSSAATINAKWRTKIDQLRTILEPHYNTYKEQN